MFWPDRGSGVPTEPARRPVSSAVRQFFTEGGEGVAPTVPGGDWFNQITNELLNVLIAAGIEPSKIDDDQLLLAIQRISKAMSAREALRRTYAEAGFNLVPGSFELGGTVTTATDVLLYEADGHAYNWDGAFPVGGKEVPEDSTPASTGGVGPGLWLDKSGTTLKYLLAGSSGGSLVHLENGKSVEQDSQQSGIARGNDGVKYAISGCAVRRDTTMGPNWGPVSDSAHIPINVTAVVGGVNVRIDFIGKKIGTFGAFPDESFACDGAAVGASVASNFANVSIGAPCSFSVDLATGEFEFDDHYFDAVRFDLSIGTEGNISITHPGIRTMLHPIIRYVAPSSTSKALDVHFQNKLTGGVTACYLVGDVEGTISYNGANWVLGSCDQWATSDLTFTWDSLKGELTVVHPVLLGSPELVLTPMYLGTPMAVSGLASAGNGFKVQFNKVADGVAPTTPNSGLGFYFSRGKNGIRRSPTGKLLVHLGYVQVNCDHVDYPGGNFWFQAIMQD